MRYYWMWNSHTDTTEMHMCETDEQALAHFSQLFGLNLTLDNPDDRVAPHMMTWRARVHGEPTFQPRGHQLDIPVYEVEA